MVEVTDESGQLVICIGGQEYARYRYSHECWRPFLYPLRAANGLSILADSPTDHRNHHGFWIGHARVNDTDCWSERHDSGRIVHRIFTEITGGSTAARFTERCDWVALDGRIILADTRSFIFFDTPSDARVFDFEIELRAPDGCPEVTLHQTNEAGLPHLRMAEGLSVNSGGTLINAEGKVGERGTYKQRSHWLDCSGKLGRLMCGVAMFDHPDNPDYPTRWFTRDYGAFSPNYAFFQETPTVITPGSPLRLRYRVYSHTGDVTDANVAGKWAEYRTAVGAGVPGLVTY